MLTIDFFGAIQHPTGCLDRADRAGVRPRKAALACAIATLVAASAPPGATAADPAAEPDATYRDIEQTLGKVPGFIRQVSKTALPGAWKEIKALEFSGDTALPAKTKALIALAVSAQIPCSYCVWQDTQGAKRAGATEQEIQEAVAISASTRHWSTIFNGMQIDFETFKKDLGGQ